MHLHNRMTVTIIRVCVRVCCYVVETEIDCDKLYRKLQQQRQQHLRTDVMRPVSHPIIRQSARCRAPVQIAMSTLCTFNTMAALGLSIWFLPSLAGSLPAHSDISGSVEAFHLTPVN